MATLYNKQITGTPGALLDSLPEWTLLEPGPVMAIDASGTGVVKASGSGSSVYELSLASVPDDVRVTFTTLSGYGGIIGVVLRCSGDAKRNGYLARIDKSNSKRLQIYTITGTATFKKQKEYTQAAMVPAEPQTVTVEVQGYTVRIWTANEPYVLEWTDLNTQFSNGSIGFYFYGATLDTVSVVSLGGAQATDVAGTISGACSDTAGAMQGAVFAGPVTGSAIAQCGVTACSVTGLYIPPAVQVAASATCGDTTGSTSGRARPAQSIVPTEALDAPYGYPGVIFGSYLVGTVPFAGDSWLPCSGSSVQPQGRVFADCSTTLSGTGQADSTPDTQADMSRFRSFMGTAEATAEAHGNGGRAITAINLPAQTESKQHSWASLLATALTYTKAAPQQESMGLRLLNGTGVTVDFSTEAVGGEQIAFPAGTTKEAGTIFFRS